MRERPFRDNASGLLTSGRLAAMKVFFKFTPAADQTDRREVIQLLRQLGAARVRRLFPRTTDADLQLQYVAETATEAGVNRLVGRLRGETSIAFAHHEVLRRPR